MTEQEKAKILAWFDIAIYALENITVSLDKVKVEQSTMDALVEGMCGLTVQQGCLKRELDHLQ